LTVHSTYTTLDSPTRLSNTGWGAFTGVDAANELDADVHSVTSRATVASEPPRTTFLVVRLRIGPV
jgi:hypothetical protein